MEKELNVQDLSNVKIKDDKQGTVITKTEEKPHKRTINELLDLPYSEMTEEEITLVIEWKAQQKAEEEHYKKIEKEQKEQVQTLINNQEKAFQEAKKTLDDLATFTSQRLQKALEISTGE